MQVAGRDDRPLLVGGYNLDCGIGTAHLCNATAPK